jgi:hypothetical protein
MAAGHFFFCLVMLGPRSSIKPPAGASLYDGTPLPAAVVSLDIAAAFVRKTT